MSTTIDELFAELAAGIPHLPGARCKGRSDIWDELDDPEIVEYAIAVCRRCPALAGCAAWLEELPARRRPHGAVAGQLNRPKQPIHSKGHRNDLSRD